MVTAFLALGNVLHDVEKQPAVEVIYFMEDDSS